MKTYKIIWKYNIKRNIIWIWTGVPPVGWYFSHLPSITHLFPPRAVLGLGVQAESPGHDLVDVLHWTAVVQQALLHPPVFPHLPLPPEPLSLLLKLPGQLSIGDVDHGLETLPGPRSHSPRQSRVVGAVDSLVKLLAGFVVVKLLRAVSIAALQVGEKHKSLTVLLLGGLFFHVLFLIVLAFNCKISDI